MTILTMFGGFTLAALAIGLADGTYAYVINMFTRNQLGHIQIHCESYLDRPSLYKTVDHYKTIGEAVGRISGVEAWAPRLYSAGLVSVGDKSSTARIIGIDPVRENTATRFDKKIVEGRSLSGPAAREVVIGRGLAKVLKARVADEVVVVSQAADGSIANDIYNIVGIAAAGDDMSDRTAFYLHLDDARELFVLEERVHEIIVIINNIDYVYKITGDIREKLADSTLTVQPWQEFARTFYQAMQVDLQANLIMLLIINLIVAVGVLNTVLMTVLERTREYGVLKAMGTRPLMIFQLVVVEVAVMIVISLIIGFILSLIINYLLATTGIPMPFKFSYGGVEFTRWYSEVNARSLYIPGITVAVVALLVSIFPASRAAHVAPADAMRTN